MYCGALVILICALVFDCNALNCRTDFGISDEKIKSVFRSCVKKLGGRVSVGNSDAGSQGWRGEQDYDATAAKGGNRRRDNNMMRNDGSPMGEEVPSVTIQGYPYFNTHPTNASSPRRNRRRRRQVQPRDAHRNSGHRSQYNPNTPEHPPMMGGAGAHGSERSGGGGMKVEGLSEENKNCVLHCLLQDLDMTGDNGMADRDLMINVMTKDVKNEELKDFLQESVEECFQLPYDKHNNDKCEFTKHILMCMAEKSSATCDDLDKGPRLL